MRILKYFKCVKLTIIFSSVGQVVKTYQYYNPAKQGLDFQGMDDCLYFKLFSLSDFIFALYVCVVYLIYPLLFLFESIISKSDHKLNIVK